MVIRVYWRDANSWDESDIVRCDEFELGDVLKLLELTKEVDYVVKAGDEFCEPYTYGYSQLVLGNTETKEVDRLDIYLGRAKF